MNNKKDNKFISSKTMQSMAQKAVNNLFKTHDCIYMETKPNWDTTSTGDIYNIEQAVTLIFREGKRK